MVFSEVHHVPPSLRGRAECCTVAKADRRLIRVAQQGLREQLLAIVPQHMHLMCPVTVRLSASWH